MALRKEFYERINLEYLDVPNDQSIQIAPNILINRMKIEFLTWAIEK